MRRIALALPMLLLLLTACADPYGSCVKAGAAIGSAIGQGMNTVANLAQQGTITPTEALNVLGYLEFANKGNEAFLTCVSAAHTAGNKAGSFTACATAFNSTLNTPAELALIHVSNTTASQTVSTIINGVTTATAAIAAALGGA